MQHLRVIDVLRAIAALSVCLFHFSAILDQAGDIAPMVRLVASRGHLGVVVFFVISGFVIPFSMRDWRLTWPGFRTFLTRRLLRLYPPYLIATVLSLALWQLSAVLPGFRGVSPSVSGLEALGNVSMTAGFLGVPWTLVVAWSLAIEVQFYAAIALVLPLCLHPKPQIRFATLIVWCALPLIAPGFQYVTSFAALFGIGLASYLYQSHRIGLAAWACSLVFAAAVHGSVHGLESAIAGLAIAAALFARPPEQGLAQYLGTISYSLYLVHVPIGGRIINLGLRGPDFPYRGVMLAGLALAGSVLAADVFHRWVEQRWVIRSRQVGLQARSTVPPEKELPAPIGLPAEAISECG
jgi:peptidoglycan/LPS O-acetylase OafA/YrhL